MQWRDVTGTSPAAVLVGPLCSADPAIGSATLSLVLSDQVHVDGLVGSLVGQLAASTSADLVGDAWRVMGCGR